MINLCSASEILRLVTSVAADVDVFASFVDKNGSTCTLDNNDGIRITTATTTTIVAAPPVGQRNVKQLSICNRDLTDSVTITVEFYDGTATTILKESIGPGGSAVLNDEGNWTVRCSPYVTRQYLTSGTGATYTTPIGVRQLFVECLSGGGGGGGCTTAATNSAAAGGGGAGLYSTATIDSPDATYMYDVGAGGTASGSGAAGNAGSESRLYLSDGVSIIVGPFTGVSSGFGGAADTVATAHVGGIGGSPGGGGIGLALAAAQAVSGAGGWSPYGAGGNSRKTTGAGNPGLGYGAGGGGSCILSGGASQPGSAGAPGLIIVTEYR